MLPTTNESGSNQNDLLLEFERLRKDNHELKDTINKVSDGFLDFRNMLQRHENDRKQGDLSVENEQLKKQIQEL